MVAFDIPNSARTTGARTYPLSGISLKWAAANGIDTTGARTYPLSCISLKRAAANGIEKCGFLLRYFDCGGMAALDSGKVAAKVSSICGFI